MPWTKLSCLAGVEEGVGPVQQVVASRFFSALLARSGRVWTFGAGFNGELGTSASWATSPQPIERLQQVQTQPHQAARSAPVC